MRCPLLPEIFKFPPGTSGVRHGEIGTGFCQVVQFLLSLVKLSGRQVEETHEIHRRKSLFRTLKHISGLGVPQHESLCTTKSLGSDSMLSPHILMFTITCPAVDLHVIRPLVQHAHFHTTTCAILCSPCEDCIEKQIR